MSKHCDDYRDVINVLSRKFTALRVDMAKTFRDVIVNMTRDMFVRHPQLNKIAWSQYHDDEHKNDALNSSHVWVSEPEFVVEANDGYCDVYTASEFVERLDEDSMTTFANDVVNYTDVIRAIELRDLLISLFGCDADVTFRRDDVLSTRALASTKLQMRDDVQKRDIMGAFGRIVNAIDATHLSSDEHIRDVLWFTTRDDVYAICEGIIVTYCRPELRRFKRFDFELKMHTRETYMSMTGDVVPHRTYIFVHRNVRA